MANLSPLPKLQFFDANGNPLSGGKLYTYAAGTTTPLATYTDSSGSTPNANPVILNSRGEASVWLGSNNYKFKLSTSVDVEVWTVDNIISDNYEVLQALAASGGSSLVGFLQSGSGASARTVQTKLREAISVKDFGAVGDGVTNDTSSLQAAITYVMSNGGDLFFPEGTYKVTGSGLTATWANHGVTFYGVGYDTVNGGSQISWDGTAGSSCLTLAGASGVHPITIKGLAFVNTGSNDGFGIRISRWRDANIENCYFANWTHASNPAAGIYPSSITYTTFNDLPEFLYFNGNYFNNCKNAVYVDLPAVHNLFFFQNRFLAGTGAAIYQKWVNDATLGETYSHHWVIRDNWFYPNTKSGLPAEIVFESGAKNILINGNYFEDNSNTGLPFIKFGAGRAQHAGIEVSNNWMSGTPAANSGLIEAGNFKGFRVVGNSIYRTLTGTTALVKYLDTNTVNPEIQIPGLGAGVTVPFAYITSANVGIVYGVVSGQSFGSWTPAITFGGGNTGIAYSIQNASYFRMNNLVTVSARIVLNNKGSSTGTMAITGLPFPMSANQSSYGAGAAANYANMNTTVTGQIMVIGAPSATSWVAAFSSTGGQVYLTDTHFTNTSQINFTASYFVD